MNKPMLAEGRPLTVQERTIFKPYFANVVLEHARIIEDMVPFWLRHNMCAVVLGKRIYFRPGVYVPNTKTGVELLGHELSHVSQFLHGMTVWRYLWSCRHGYHNSTYELEAYAKGRLIASNYQ
ncbi:MAG TPA: DUF4157 domain-containing protein [Methylotenera sp.]|nr:DUF4157 domain-containing protein [Methylotenera sp.]